MVFSILSSTAQDTPLTKNKIIEDGKTYYLYEVKESEGFMAIGRQFGVAYQDIIDANKGIAFSGLKVGELIRIPVIEGRNTNTAEIKSDDFVYHKVEAGETLFFISRKYGVSIHDIVINNPGSESVLSLGMELKIPKETQAAKQAKVYISDTTEDNNADAKFRYHTVQPSETTYGIARKYGVAPEDIAKANPGINSNSIKIGTKLRIPKTFKKIEKQLSSEELTDTRFTYHRIKNGESLESIAMLYHIPQAVIINTNHLGNTLSPVGYILKIPHTYEYEVEVEKSNQVVYIIQKKDDIREIAEKYQTPIMDIQAANPDIKKWKKLKRGDKLTIPTLTISSVDSMIQRNPRSQERADLIRYFERQEASLGDTLNVAFIWPLFLEKNDTINVIKEKDPVSNNIIISELATKNIYPISSRYREFYFSALMAINDLKDKGIKVKLSSYDSKKSAVDVIRLLRDSTLKDNDIIFGPGLPNQIRPVADFCLENHIRMVVPYYSECESVKDNPFVFQIIPGSGVEYPQIAEDVAANYNSANIILVKGNQNDKRETQFTEILKSELYNPDSLLYRDIHYKEINFNLDYMGGLTALLSHEKQNLVIIPAEKSIDYTSVVPVLYNYKKNHPEIDIKLLGFSEWQGFDRRELENIFNVECELFSPFYSAINDSTATKLNYINQYKSYFTGEPTKTYPYYGMLGYDVCTYFLTGLAQYGNLFEKHLDELKLDGLCVDLHFERVNNWGGFVNTTLYKINYTKDYDIQLISKH